MRAIADTGFLVAFVNRNDQYHEWALSLAQHVTDPLLTCESVLAEAAFQLADTASALGLLETGLVQIAFNMPDHSTRLVQLAKQYRDRKPDLADLCLICMSELYPKHPVVTTDLRDFRVYRRHRREVIPLIHPVTH